MARRITKAGIIYEFAPAIARPAAHYWRAFVGPVWRPHTDAHAYNWGQHSAGDPIDAMEAENTVLYTLDPGETTLDLIGAWPWPSGPGGLWIGPFADDPPGQGWEYIDYSAQTDYQATGILREPAATAEHNRTHGAGAPVRQWYEITTDNGEIHLERSRDENLLVESWIASISGARAPAAVLRNDHLVAVAHRASHLDPWALWLLGWMRDPRLSDDDQRNAAWQFQIVSLYGQLEATEADGIRIGTFDLAQHGSASSSTPLPTVAAHLERGAGDFQAAQPDLSVDNVITPDASAPWISDRMTGTGLSNLYNYGGITQIYINPPPTVNRGRRYIEITGRATAGSVFLGYDSVLGQTMAIDIPSLTLADNETLILCENEELFREHWPTASPTAIYSVENTAHPNFFQRLHPEQGALAFRSFDAESNYIPWGGQTPPVDWDTGSWSGATLAAPGYDQVMRYLYPNTPTPDNSDATQWAVDAIQAPAYAITADGDDVWITVELPSLGLQLRDTITPTAPAFGEYLYIDNADGPSVDGLPSAGTVVIGDEQIDYMSKSPNNDYVVVGGRGVNGTTAAGHDADDPVYYIDSISGAVIDAPPITEIKWSRRGGTIYPADFVIRTSPLIARTPEQSLHEGDYSGIYTITGNAAAEGTQATAAGYENVKTIAFEFQRMTSDPARARMNRIIANADPARYSADRWLSGLRSVADVAAALLAAAGVPVSARQALGGTATISEQETERSTVGALLTDLAEQTNTEFIIGLDSKVTTQPGQFWAASTITVDHTWTEANTATIEEIRTGGAMIAQIRLAWRTADGATQGEAIHPDSADPRGRIVEIEEQIYTDQATADRVAQRKYELARYPYSALVMPAAGDLAYAPGAIHAHNWTFDPTGSPTPNRRYIVRNVDQRISRYTLETAIVMQEIERSSA